MPKSNLWQAFPILELYTACLGLLGAARQHKGWCAQAELWDLGMHPENVYYQYNANHNQQAGMGSLQDKREEESLCLDWAERKRS